MLALSPPVSSARLITRSLLIAALLIPVSGCAAAPVANTSSKDTTDGDEDKERAKRDAGSRKKDASTSSPRESASSESHTESAAKSVPKASVPATVPPPDACGAIEKDAPTEQRIPVDIVFVIDDSGSMDPHKAKVRANLAKFMEEFAQSRADAHVVIVDEDDLAGPGIDRERYMHVPLGAASGGLYFTATIAYPLFAGFLRPGAATHLIFVTDENDDWPGEFFQGLMTGILGQEFILHAIACDDVGAGIPCAARDNPLLRPLVNVGTNYFSLAQATGGKQLSLCTEDWSEVFSQLNDSIIEAVPLPCDFPLAEAKSNSFDPDKLSMVHSTGTGPDIEFAKASSVAQCAQQKAWHYDDETNPTLAQLCPAACEAVRAVVEERLPNIPRPQAQKVADFLGIKLRPLAR
jgi:hypothetical protein